MQRTAIAQSIIDRLKTRLGGRLLLGGVAGSAVRGDATEFSDLDLVVVVREVGDLAPQQLLFQGIVISCAVICEADLLAALRGERLEWAYWMGMLHGTRALCGNAERLTAWRDLGAAVPLSHLRATLEQHLPALVFESYGRVRSAAMRSRERDAMHATTEILYEMRTALCLLNGRWITQGYYGGFGEVAQFPLLPQGYREHVDELWVARDLDTLVSRCGSLVNAYWRLLTSQSLNITNYQSVESLPL